MDKENIINIHMHIMGVLLSHKEKKIMSFARKWVEMEIIMLREII
jgi:hypothetical protein